MKKLSILTAGLLLGFGLVSCEGDKEGASTDDKNPAAENQNQPADHQMETVSLKVTGMT